MVNREECVIEVLNGVEFFIGASKKFNDDFALVSPILVKARKDMHSLTRRERLTLIRVYRAAFHTEHKIAGATSLDSSCHGCEFCQKMRQAAEDDITIICAFCYDHKYESYRVNVENRHKLNMLIMSTVEFEEDELALIPVTQITRINSSGDIVNEIHARNMIKVCLMNPFVNFGFWAKHTLPVIKACDSLGKPENCVLIQSSIYIGKAAKLQRYFDYTFTVYATEEDLQEALRQGGVECNGKMCADCGWNCYFGRWAKGSNICELQK